MLFALLSNLSFSQVAERNYRLEINPKNNCLYRYFYYPNIQTYYDSLKKVFYYKQNGEWITTEELPQNYGGYSLYKFSRVDISDYDDDEPYLLIEEHKIKYPYKRKGY